jgi:hypothetical protein
VPYPPPGLSEVEFGAGLLDDDPSVRPSNHIFVASSAPWERSPSDGLPQWHEQARRARAFGARGSAGWRSLSALADRFVSASAAHARALGFSRDDDWFLLKLFVRRHGLALGAAITRK